MMMGALMLVGSVMQTPAGGEAAHFRLLCPGTQEGSVADVRSGFAYGSNGQSASGTAIGSRPYYAQEIIRIEIDGDAGRIIQSSGKDWSKLKNIVITNDEITASAVVGLMRPKIRIDRHTGDFASRLGNTTIKAVCRPYPEGQRAF